MESAAIRDQIGEGGQVTAGDPLFLELMEMFRWHPSYEAKTAAGVTAVKVQTNTVGNALEFWLVKADGSSEDISFHKTKNAYVPLGKRKPQ